MDIRRPKYPMHHLRPRWAGVFYVVLSLGWICILPLEAKEPGSAPNKPEIQGRLGENRYSTPTGQILTPAGRQVELPTLRPQALALSPDGKRLVTSGKSAQLYVIDLAKGTVVQKVNLPATAAERKPSTTNADDDPTDDQETESTPKPDSKALLSFTGLTYSPDGTRIYLSNVRGNIKVFGVDKAGEVTGLTTWPLPEAKAPKRKEEIPAGLAVSANGKRLYVAGNLGNKLYELDTADGTVVRTWDTGVAPFEVVLAAGKAYVSNTGGRAPGTNDLAAPAGKGTTVRVDPVRFIANEGSVTIIDLASGRAKAELVVEWHASGLAVSPDKRYVVVANAGSDTLSVIDTRTDWIVERIWARQSPADLFGAQPNALAFDRSGKRLFVCNGTQNAVAVVQFEPQDKESKLIGMIPTGWFPGAVVYHPRRDEICVANIKGIGAAKVFKPDEPIKLQTKSFFGTLSLIPAPNRKTLETMTAVALLNMRYPKLQEVTLPARTNQAPRPVPERTGEPSVFQHVIYVIKENRTYDQVLGDMTEGNGNTNLCTFGEQFTPNQHKIAREFVLLDNTYCSGVQSADGHQWTDSAIANEYIERQLTADFPRSYPGGKEADAVDALAWASSGFIWDHALAHGKTFRNYGEWMISEAGWTDTTKKDKPVWMDFWNDFQKGEDLTFVRSKAGIASLRHHSNTNTIGWDLRVPDIVRADEFIKELRHFELQGGFPSFMILFLPNDHTGGTRRTSPKPGAQVADNDLAFGRVVEAVSHSAFWPKTCILAIEDDPQAGWDHVSGYRTTCYVVSPYTKRRQTISTQYNQVSLIRTIELILGLPPMNQLDATATPMFDCFMMTPDLTPFTSVTNQVALDELNPSRSRRTSAEHPSLREDMLASERLPLDEPDRCPEDVFNRILWRAMKGPDVPYPEWAVTLLEDDDDD